MSRFVNLVYPTIALLTFMQGLRRISPKPTPEDLIKEMLVYVLDPNDLERSYVKFDDGDEIWLLVNNLGGIPALEIEGLTQVILEQLSQDYGIMPSRIYVGPFETSLNAPGFSLSLCNLSAIANATSRPVASLRDLLDAPTTASAWPRSSYQVSLPVSSDTPVSHSGNSLPDGNKHNTVSDTPAPYALLPALKTACLAAIEAEPDITRFDMIMGDGDCGEAVRAACEALLARFSEAPFAESHFSLFSALEAINETLEDVGGSLFAILSILTTAFVGHLQGNSDITRSTVGNAAGSAVRALHAYTGARVGDRTCMDVLIPFCEVLESTGGDLVAAVEAAEEAAKATAIMAPRFGRAAYVGDDAPAAGDMSPDPGAYAVARWLHGFARKWDEMAV
ncbi:dhal domain-containing protein [Aspergillus karnatakaensis]|uniref:dhal domain-containing protein n=1 Tax=Aspergillus karnatakaensis TaxID=1810916 RepID=UPI003CCD66F7